jgi:hypothetical protein
VTEQWFGIHLPGKGEPDLSVIQSDSIQILQAKRHNKKLRVGYLKGNHFTLRLTGLEQAGDLEARLQAIATQGVPNYYGEQRFRPGWQQPGRGQGDVCRQADQGSQQALPLSLRRPQHAVQCHRQRPHRAGAGTSAAGR